MRIPTLLFVVIIMLIGIACSDDTQTEHTVIGEISEASLLSTQLGSVSVFTLIADDGSVYYVGDRSYLVDAVSIGQRVEVTYATEIMVAYLGEPKRSWSKIIAFRILVFP